MDKVKCSPNLPVCVHVLSEKNMGQVNDLCTTTWQFFFFFIDWCTGIKKKKKKKGFCIIFVFSVKFPSSLPLLSSFFILSAPLLISFCGAVAILLHLASLLGCRLGVSDEMASGHSTKKYTGSWKNKNCGALVYHFLSTHSNMCDWACTCTHTHMHIHSWLLYTSFNTYRCRAVWFS